MQSKVMKTVDYNKIAQEYARHRQIHPEVLRSLLANGGVEAVSKVLEGAVAPETTLSPSKSPPVAQAGGLIPQNRC
jgi:hypothetical protein